MDPQQGQPALQIGDYLATLRLRRWLVLAIAAVFTIGGVLYSLTLNPSYVATSRSCFRLADRPHRYAAR